MQSNLNHTLELVGKEKGIDKEVLIAALESAMLTAARKRFGPDKELEVHYNEEIGEIEIFEFKTVVAGVPARILRFRESRENPALENGLTAKLVSCFPRHVLVAILFSTRMTRKFLEQSGYAASRYS